MSSINRVPNEVWEGILSCLYQSQLSRMSMVNKNLNVIVSSLEVWPRMFNATYGPEAQLRLLMCIPNAKSSYMMFMCASSLHVCEKCFGQTGYNAHKLYWIPLPIPVLPPRRSTDIIKYVDARSEPNWTIQMCLLCRQGHNSDLEEPVPRNVTNGMMAWVNLCDKYPCAKETQGLFSSRRGNSLINELDAFSYMRRYFGGDIGIKAFKTSTEAYDAETETRILLYQCQE